MKRDKLLFYFSDENCDASVAVIPTLALLAEKQGIDFETYICTRPDSIYGKLLPTVGHGHIESFYYLANFYKKIIFCSISSFKSAQFKREIAAFGGDIVSCRSNNEVLSFYEDVFGYFGCELPSEAMVVPKKPDNYHKDSGIKWIAPYCYPDIQFSGKLGLDENTFNANNAKLKELGITKIDTVYCNVEAEGFTINCIDIMTADESYFEVTKRIADRNLKYAKGVGFADPSEICRCEVQFCRRKLITFYQPYEWMDYIPTISKYAKKLGNHTVLGNQVVYEPNKKIIGCVDHVITAFAQNGIVMDLIGVNPRVGFSIQTDFKLDVDWLKDTPAPWEDEYSDEYLKERIAAGDIPVCFLFYAADLGHLPVLPRFLDLMSMDNIRAGIAFPATWYDYQPELLEQLYIPLQQGGVFPQLEPLISSVGMGVASEAKDYISPEFLTELLNAAKDKIKSHVGERLVPKGYYPFQDSSPFYQAGTGEPQYDVIDKVGFEYYITYKNGNKPASIEYESDTMTVINQQRPQWMPDWGTGRTPIDVLREWEEYYTEKTDKPGWIIMPFDTPFYGLSPLYLGNYLDAEDKKKFSMNRIMEVMQYVRHTGGKSGKLFMLKPHELYRYAKLLKEQNLI